MKNWATLPYELLKLIFNCIPFSDLQTKGQFQRVCKHWHAPAAHLAFRYICVDRLEKLSSLTALILRNRDIGATIRSLNIDVTNEERNLERQLHSDDNSEEADNLLKTSVLEFDLNRSESYKTLLTILLRFVPNIDNLRFKTKDAEDWYHIVTASSGYLKNLHTLQPPSNFREIRAYNTAAYSLHESLEKVTFMNRGEAVEDIFSLSQLTPRATDFTNLTEIRVELLEAPTCLVPELETIIDVLPQIDFLTIACTLAVWNVGATKLVFPDIDTSTIKPLLNIKRLRGLHCYFCDDNAIKYITHKFPNVYELAYNVKESPWMFYHDFQVTDTPNQLSSRAQTDLFNYMMKMTRVDIYGVYLKTDIPPMMTRWMNVANKIKDKYTTLVLLDEDRVETNCAYVFWKKNPWFMEYEIKIAFNDNSDFLYTQFVQNLGRCLQCIKIEHLQLNSEILSQIYEGCPSLNQIEFISANIQNEIDTGETTSKLERMCFKYMEESSAKWIPSITRNLPELYSLEVIACEITERKENPPDDNNRFKFKDLVFDISATHAYEILYVPIHGFFLPWCIIMNDEKMFLIEEAFDYFSTNYKISGKEVPLSDYDKYEKELESKVEFRYCVRIKCQGLHSFVFSRDFSRRGYDFEQTWGNDSEPPSADNFVIVLM